MQAPTQCRREVWDGAGTTPLLTAPRTVLGQRVRRTRLGLSALAIWKQKLSPSRVTHAPLTHPTLFLQPTHC